jgi:hypothetical protein
VFKKDSPYKLTACKEVCPLMYVHLFDLAWDICPDMMHTYTGMWYRHIFGLFCGWRTPSQVKSTKKNTAAQNAQLHKDHAKAKRQVEEWRVPKVHAYTYIFKSRCL